MKKKHDVGNFPKTAYQVILYEIARMDEGVNTK
jgi:hypothetical protein